MKLADLEVSTENGVVIARIAGEIDMSNSEELHAALVSALPRDAPAMVLDLTGVDYMDSAGIRLVYRLTEDVKARRQKLQVVVPPTSMVAEVLRLAGVTDWVSAVETVDAALARLRDS